MTCFESLGGDFAQAAAQGVAPHLDPAEMSEAASAAETFAMQRMTQHSNQEKSRTYWFRTLAAALLAIAITSQAKAQFMGSGVVQADYAASGFVTPAGMIPPEEMARLNPSGIMQVGYNSPACDAPIGCDSGCDSMSGGSCDGGSGSCGGRRCVGGGIFGSVGNSCDGPTTGLLGSLGNCACGNKSCIGGGSGCGLDLRNMCIWCGGQGCSACQLHKHGHSFLGNIGAFLNYLKPYEKAGICSQRWYDLSAEVVALGHTTGAAGVGAVTSQGPGGPTVLSLGQNSADLEVGARVSGALLFGPGGNFEMTYMGGHEWDDTVSVFGDANTPTLFSFVSDFGLLPPNGFDDTDRSLEQSLENRSRFHTAEINYRRRTVWPYCRFQGSWLVGLRYLRFDDTLIYRTRGTVNNATTPQTLRFFESNDRFRNSLFGPQIGYDFWWNIRPGISLGYGLKGAWVLNDIDRTTSLRANSLNLPAATAGTRQLNMGMEDTSILGELEFKLAWRFSHSWTIRSAYYCIAADDMAFGGLDRETILDFVNNAAVVRAPDVQLESLVVQGVSGGIEYTW